MSKVIHAEQRWICDGCGLPRAHPSHRMTAEETDKLDRIDLEAIEEAGNEETGMSKVIHEAKSNPRPLAAIAADIYANWPREKMYFGAVPYLDAMFSLQTMQDSYGADSAKSVVAYFLANAGTWRGEAARRIKKELNGMLR